jgi:hypothetical protein
MASADRCPPKENDYYKKATQNLTGNATVR